MVYLSYVLVTFSLDLAYIKTRKLFDVHTVNMNTQRIVLDTLRLIRSPHMATYNGF